MKGKRIMLKKMAGSSLSPEFIGEVLFISGLESEEDITTAEVGQMAVLGKRF